jgi:hypothetical protein
MDFPTGGNDERGNVVHNLQVFSASALQACGLQYGGS